MNQRCAGSFGDRSQPTAVIRELLITLRDVAVEFDDVRVLQTNADTDVSEANPECTCAQHHLGTKLIRRAIDAHHEVSRTRRLTCRTFARSREASRALLCRHCMYE